MHNLIPGYRIFAVVLALCCAWVGSLRAQDLEPRSYTNVPVGETFVVLGAARSDGEISPTPSSPLEEAELTIDSALFGLAHTFDLAGKSAKLDVATARLCYEGSAIFQGEFVEGRRCEYADPKMRLTWNFYGAPALTLKDFASWKPGLVVGGSLQVSIPVGTYDSEHLINAGANRWMVRPGIGMSRRRGRFSWELMASVRWFEDNDDFFNGVHVEQDPLYSLQAHFIYRFNKGRWISVNGNWFQGGETTQDGVEADDYMENSRWGLTFSMPLSPHHSLKFFGHTGVVTRVGNEFDTYGAAWQYRF